MGVLGKKLLETLPLPFANTAWKIVSLFNANHLKRNEVLKYQFCIFMWFLFSLDMGNFHLVLVFIDLFVCFVYHVKAYRKQEGD